MQQRPNVQMFKMFSGPFFRMQARVHYYIRDNTPNGDTNTDDTNIDYDDEAFENIPDDGK